jgi:hypothetical protein
VIVMIDQLRARLAELKREYQLGEAQLRELVREEAALRETLLRISGAIQVLEELTPAQEAAQPGQAGAAPAGAGQTGAGQTGAGTAGAGTAGENGANGRPDVLTVP